MNNKIRILKQKQAENDTQIALYESGKVALTKPHIDDLYAIKNVLPTQIRSVCIHDQVRGVRDSNYYTDEYGSGVTDYHVRLECLECDQILQCDQILLDKMTGEDYIYIWKYSSPLMSLKEGCIWWEEQPGAYTSRDAKTIEDYGVRKVERRTYEYVSTKL